VARAPRLTARALSERLAGNDAPLVVDVRTDAEWAFVGLPDLSKLEKSPILVPWQTFPDMRINPNFAEAYNNLGLTLKEMGKLKEAEENFSRALRINPEYATARQNLEETAAMMRKK